ncbi:MAG: sulfurtransferase-like selenium metabolism protein YedF [Acidobacteria bacterium]|nr:sulfurtransferase-like selenium metabolism protein YedF [Acidobacteriota bacterium]
MTDIRHDTVFVITSETLGRGDDELGRQLMAKFVLQLSQQRPKPHAVLFYNAGVKLLTHNSASLDGFRAIEHDGVDLVACGTCVDFFAIRDVLAAGRISDMREIVATINAAAKVVTI